MAADDEQDLLAFLADLGDGDDPVDAADPDDAQEAMFFIDNKEPREHETVSGIRILRGLYFSFDIA